MKQYAFQKIIVINFLNKSLDLQSVLACYNQLVTNTYHLLME